MCWALGGQRWGRKVGHRMMVGALVLVEVGRRVCGLGVVVVRVCR